MSPFLPFVYYKAVFNAVHEGALVKGIAGVDRSTCQLIIAKIK
jgi:hypothetical protein